MTDASDALAGDGAAGGTDGGTVGAARPRRKLELWRSPAGQPAWARPALLAVTALAAVLYACYSAGNLEQMVGAGDFHVVVQSADVTDPRLVWVTQHCRLLDAAAGSRGSPTGPLDVWFCGVP